MVKRPSSNLYTQRLLGDENSTSSYLFSHGRRKTKMKSSFLPPWYMPGVFYGNIPGFISAKGVVRLVYKPNLISGTMFADDSLYIYYRKTGSAKDANDSFDECIHGTDIPRFLIWAEKYSGYDTSKIEHQIESKRVWFMNAFPHEYVSEIGKDESIMDFYRFLYSDLWEEVS